MKIYNRSGEPISYSNINTVIKTSGVRLGSDGYLYINNESDSQWYKTIIKTVNGIKSLSIDEENPLSTVP